MLSLIRSKQTYFYLLLLCSIGIGLQLVVYKIAIVVLLLQWMISAEFNQKIIKLRKNNFAIGMISLYFIYALSFLWSDNIEFALTDLVLKIPILILPLIIASQEDLTKKQINHILFSFAFSIVLLNLFCLGIAYFNYIDIGKINEFYYHRLTLNMHTAYQAMFTCFSIVIFIYLRIKEKFISNWMMLPVIFIQMIFVLLLSSRMQILIMAVLVPSFLILYYHKKRKIILGLLYTILIFSCAELIMSIPSSLNYRYKQTVSRINSIGVDNDNSDARKFIWAEALKGIKNNWLIGAGVGDAKDALVERYSRLILKNPTSEFLMDSTIYQIEQNDRTIVYLQEKAKCNKITYKEQLNSHAKLILERENNRHMNFIKKKYNFHNQYLQIFGTIGVFGVLLLIWLLAFPFFKSLKGKDYLLASFLFIVGASLLTESMLERQAGVVFIAFFYLLLTGRVTENKLF